MANLNRHLVGHHKELINSHFNAILTDAQMGRSVQCSINGKTVTKYMIRQFCTGSDLDSVCIDTVLELFRLRDKRIVSAHHSVNKGRNNYVRLPKNLFCSPTLMFSLIENEPAVIDSYFSENFNIHEFSYAFIPWQTTRDNQNIWSLIVIDCKRKNLFLFCCDLEPGNISPIITAQMKRVDEVLQPLLHKLFPDMAVLPQCSAYPYLYSEVVHEASDSGVMVLTILYYLVKGCPIAFMKSDFDKLRFKFPYWLLLESLPL